jgi:hypothetical protein
MSTRLPCFSITTGAEWAVSINRPKLCLASRAEGDFIALPIPSVRNFGLNGLSVNG